MIELHKFLEKFPADKYHIDTDFHFTTTGGIVMLICFDEVEVYHCYAEAKIKDIDKLLDLGVFSKDTLELLEWMLEEQPGAKCWKMKLYPNLYTFRNALQRRLEQRNPKIYEAI